MPNNNIRIALTEEEVSELRDGDSIYITIKVGGEEKTVEIYQGDEEDNG